MKDRGEYKFNPSVVLKKLGQYKYVFLVITAGILLLMLPVSKENQVDDQEYSVVEEDFSVDALEEKLCGILSEIDGAGRVNVMLTVESGMKRVFAQDIQMEREGDTFQNEAETVIVSSGNGMEDTVLVQQIYPRFQGALVVADGGGEPSVRLNITEAVAALTGLGADKISVCKGK